MCVYEIICITTQGNEYIPFESCALSFLDRRQKLITSLSVCVRVMRDSASLALCVPPRYINNNLISKQEATDEFATGNWIIAV